MRSNSSSPPSRSIRIESISANKGRYQAERRESLRLARGQLVRSARRTPSGLGHLPERPRIRSLLVVNNHQPSAAELRRQVVPLVKHPLLGRSPTRLVVEPPHLPLASLRNRHQRSAKHRQHRHLVNPLSQRQPLAAARRAQPQHLASRRSLHRLLDSLVLLEEGRQRLVKHQRLVRSQIPLEVVVPLDSLPSLAGQLPPRSVNLHSLPHLVAHSVNRHSLGLPAAHLANLHSLGLPAARSDNHPRLEVGEAPLARRAHWGRRRILLEAAVRLVVPVGVLPMPVRLDRRRRTPITRAALSDNRRRMRLKMRVLLGLHRSQRKARLASHLSPERRPVPLVNHPKPLNRRLPTRSDNHRRRRRPLTHLARNKMLQQVAAWTHSQLNQRAPLVNLLNHKQPPIPSDKPSLHLVSQQDLEEQRRQTHSVHNLQPQPPSHKQHLEAGRAHRVALSSILPCQATARREWTGDYQCSRANLSYTRIIFPGCAR